ncbi:UNVERIFIED_CONTAM: E3 ubiquitin-protein ligase SIRP1 [Sesamum latifolium]|uniref:RING-type E3 ubiquitin transferase n=1 Tax=Sesamum latifolium TaxID=2727402 RepID=A0AAW2VDT1_9LAMI
MAGMLPGVEAARREDFTKAASSATALTSLQTHPPPPPSPGALLSVSMHPLMTSIQILLPCFDLNYYCTVLEEQRNPGSLQQVCDESRLGAAAREAKKRIEPRTPSYRHGSGSLEDQPTVRSNLQTEAPKLKKNGSKKLNWLKLSWKSSEQEECAVCLEQFNEGRGRGRGRQGETLMQLPCGHRFHTNCLVPWLEANAHCPCCRMEIPS